MFEPLTTKGIQMIEEKPLESCRDFLVIVGYLIQVLLF